MAKVTVNIDTESGDFSVNVNGETMENVSSVSCYRYDYAQDGNVKTCLSTNISLMDEIVDGIRKCTYISTAGEKDTEAKAELSRASASFIDNKKTLVKYSKSPSLSSQIADLLKANRTK